MDRKKKTEEERLLNRRQVLKLAGFTVTGAALGLPLINAVAAQQPASEDIVPGSRSTHFQHLFTPLKIGTFTARNRILSTAHYTGFAEGGLPSERHRAYWGSKARGGIGLVFTDCQPVHPTGGISPLMIQCYRSEIAQAFKPITEEIHQAGGKIIAQVWHPGKSIDPRSVSEAVSSSAIPSRLYGTRARPLTVREIRELVVCYARSARWLREGGLDGVELHCAHNYLPLQFMSPLHNNRTDEYGGSEENRIRFVVEAIKAIRKEVGDDFTFGIRITGDEFAPGGLTLADMTRITPQLAASGNLDYINVSLGGPFTIAPMGSPQGAYVYLAEGIKAVVKVPVFCIGRIVDPAMADEIVKQKRADMVGMTRANMCDPELANKAREGRVDEIRPCIGLMYCWSRTTHREGITCGLNPSVGHEEKYKILPAKRKKRIMIVGGGAAGMEAARVAAERGHRVALYERDPFLGGQLIIAAKTPGRSEMNKSVVYYQNQLKRLGVTVRLGVSVSRQMIEKEAPDEIIVATGGLPRAMPIPGAASGQAVQCQDVLMGKAETGKKVVVVATDAGMEGLGTAEFLADQGKSVEVLISQENAGQDLEKMITRSHLLSRLDRKNIVLTTGSHVEALQGKTIIASRRGEPYRIENVDTVVLSLGSASNDELLKSLSSLKTNVHAIGQCRQVGGLFESISDGLKVALEI
jgi:2,4-dienoyl-CoA reductase-like NADH-dependent reductase (Old Yellow Enzyme family)/thioredoxin reductase